MKNKILNRFIKGLIIRRRKARAVLYILLVVIIGIFTYYTYTEYEKTIVTQQQQNMLNISRSISRSIEFYISDVVDSMKVVALDRDFIKNVSNIGNGGASGIYKGKLKSYYDAEDKSIDAIYFINKDGGIVSQYPGGMLKLDNDLEYDIKNALHDKTTYIGRAYMNKGKNYFILNIFEPVYDKGDFKGMVAVSISLDVIYNRLIDPVRIGEKGYAMVKDQNGIIIMHTVKEQVGMDVIETRKQVYPGLDYTELEELISSQLKGEEGTAVYHSYWWGDKVLEKAKKLNAYTPVRLGEHFWIVAITMSYDEIQGPINRFLIKVIGIAVLIAIFLFIFISTMIRMRKNKEELIRETRYLKMLNEKSEQLRKKEAELYHSHKLKMIGTLTGGIAHDINNLLTPILGYSELLLMRIPKESEYFEEVEEIYNASQKGKDLIDQILLFSRNDNGIAKVEPIDINKVTRETIKLVRAVLPRKLVINENIEENIGLINANYTQIHQVIFNLCTNAYQAVENNDGRIEVSLKRVGGEIVNSLDGLMPADRDYAEIVVSDTGCGMDKETRERIFEPFFTTKTIGEGTGLGLYVVQSIIDKHDGVITVESEVGNGSTFKVYLPLLHGRDPIERASCTKYAIEGNKRILVVDDNEEILKMLKKGLEHLGYEVIIEKNSLKALKYFKSHSRKFDLVITDYMMPELKGIELATEIKELRDDIGVILMTGYMDENEKSIASANVFDACISKPIELNKLAEVIKEVLSLNCKN